jgi:hypothetical protein
MTAPVVRAMTAPVVLHTTVLVGLLMTVLVGRVMTVPVVLLTTVLVGLAMTAPVVLLMTVPGVLLTTVLVGRVMTVPVERVEVVRRSARRKKAGETKVGLVEPCGFDPSRKPQLRTRKTLLDSWLWLDGTEGASCRRDAPLATRGTDVGLRLFVRESSALRACLCCNSWIYFSLEVPWCI